MNSIVHVDMMKHLQVRNEEQHVCHAFGWAVDKQMH